MKRLLEFNVADDAYIIQENGSTLFEIKFDELRFDSRAFYQGIYSNGKSANIQLVNKASADQSKKLPYIYKWISEIVEEIHKELGDEDESPSVIVNLPLGHQVPLFDMAVCAGAGEFVDNQQSLENYISTSFSEADFALRISGDSMEPTLENGSIVLVKRTEVPDNGQVVVASVDGRLMVKRYYCTEKSSQLIPDNNSGEFETITIDDSMDVRIQGCIIGMRAENGNEKPI